MSKAIQARLDLLFTEVQRHDHLYHHKDNPIIEDQEYDRIKQELTTLETSHPDLASPESPTAAVGAPPSDDFQPLQHPTPMLSLGNAHSEADFRAWHSRINKLLGDHQFPFTIEPKIDGLAVRLTYRNGNLQQAATRGDGMTGEDVTHSVATIDCLPHRLHTSQSLEFRGEVYMPRSTFELVNRERSARGDQPFANPRNAAAGGIRTHDTEETRRRRLAMLVYTAHLGHDSHHKNLSLAADLQLPVSEHTFRVNSPEEAVTIYNTLLGQRDSFEYETDGLVFKVDSLTLQKKLGQTGHEPRWAIAWKWPAQTASTMLTRIEISHGRFGKLTPVAVLEPVNVAGVTIQSATLHNESDVHRKDIREGDLVILQRAGDVIPQVAGPVDTNPDRPLPVFRMPALCPTCSTAVTTDHNAAAHWCPNEDCPSRLPEWLEHFVSKRAMNIEHLGPTWCRALIDNGLVTEDPADLYSLTPNQLAKLHRMGPNNAHRLMNSINASKKQPLDRILYSLGVYRLGRKVSNTLARLCNAAEDAALLSPEQLAVHDGIGPMIASHVHHGLNTKRTRNMLRKMADAGVQTRQSPKPEMKENTSKMNKSEFFAGNTFVVTGKLEHYTRDQIHDLINSMGGNTASSVTRATKVLVVGDKPGSKLKKAKEYGAQIITEAELLEHANS